MNEKIISWNVQNWITVTLMAAITLFLAISASKLIRGGGGGEG